MFLTCNMTEIMFLFLDRICELCFEMFRHQNINLRAECRQNCFTTDMFNLCFNFFNISNQGEPMFDVAL